MAQNPHLYILLPQTSENFTNFLLNIQKHSNIIMDHININYIRNKLDVLTNSVSDLLVIEATLTIDYL